MSNFDSNNVCTYHYLCPCVNIYLSLSHFCTLFIVNCVVKQNNNNNNNVHSITKTHAHVSLEKETKWRRPGLGKQKRAPTF